MDRRNSNGWLFTIIALLLLAGVGWWLWRAGNEVAHENRDVPQATSTTAVFSSQEYDFTIRYPRDFTVNDRYEYEALGEERAIPGVSFTVPSSMATGTNLSADTRLSIEVLSSTTTTCAAALFLDGVATSTPHMDGVVYSVASSSDAGAGNRYEEVVYALPGSSPCTAVRYFIHHTVLENYATGTVRAFDRPALLALFDGIRRSLTLTR